MICFRWQDTATIDWNKGMVVFFRHFSGHRFFLDLRQVPFFSLIVCFSLGASKNNKNGLKRKATYGRAFAVVKRMNMSWNSVFRCLTIVYYYRYIIYTYIHMILHICIIYIYIYLWTCTVSTYHVTCFAWRLPYQNYCKEYACKSNRTPIDFSITLRTCRTWKVAKNSWFW